MHLNWQQAIGIDESHLTEFSDGLGGKALVSNAIVNDLTRLFEAAAQRGLPLAIVSGFRSFDRQLKIWNDKWMGYRPVYSRHGRPLNILNMSDIEKYKAIALWSAMPGLSRHHWGTDLDIFLAKPIKEGYQVELTPEEFSETGPCSQLEEWLENHLPDFGFFRPYKTYQGGVSSEPWHISHHQTSQQILDNFDFKSCTEFIAESDIKSAKFINNQLDHYRQQYFENISEQVA